MTIVRPNRCRARPVLNEHLQCEADQGHSDRHWATESSGFVLHWTEPVAVYPPANPDRTQVGDGPKCDCTRRSDHTLQCASGLSVGVNRVNRLGESVEDAVTGQASETRLTQVGGEHYREFAIQPWDVIDEYGLSFYGGSVLKYLLRAGHKGPAVEDLKKCRHCLDKLIEIEEGKA